MFILYNLMSHATNIYQFHQQHPIVLCFSLDIICLWKYLSIIYEFPWTWHHSLNHTYWQHPQILYVLKLIAENKSYVGENTQNLKHAIGDKLPSKFKEDIFRTGLTLNMKYQSNSHVHKMLVGHWRLIKTNLSQLFRSP